MICPRVAWTLLCSPELILCVLLSGVMLSLCGCEEEDGEIAAGMVNGSAAAITAITAVCITPGCVWSLLQYKYNTIHASK